MSGPVPWELGMANGMSNRRSTLKRPIVCRSKKDGNCGKVAITCEIIPLIHLPGDHVLLVLSMTALQDPLDNQYDLLIGGPYIPTQPPPKITIGPEYQIELIAPMVSGSYTTAVIAINSQGCRVDSQADSVVV